MKVSTRLGTVVAGALVACSFSPLVTAQAAEPCVSGAEVRAQVHALVAGLADDVRSRAVRAQVAAALVETLKASRGAKADTVAERRALGTEVSALAKTLKDAPGLVERKAIVVQIRALTSQRQQGPVTAAQRTRADAALAALKKAVVAKTDGGAEGRAVAASFKALHDQFTCTPA
jgi:hypothetical protein